MKEDDPKKNQKISQQLKDKIRKKMYIQKIQGTQFTYSLLKKKNEKFIFSNERLLVLAHPKTIGYARNIPD